MRNLTELDSGGILPPKSYELDIDYIKTINGKESHAMLHVVCKNEEQYQQFNNALGRGSA